MLRIQGLKCVSGAVGRMGSTALLLALGAAAGGCSTDFRRLEQPTYGLNERPPLPSATMSARRNAGAPMAADESWPSSGARAPLPPVTAGPGPATPTLPPTAGLSKPFDKPKASASTASNAGHHPTAGSVDVQPGDTLYAIAKRHHVSIAALMEANQLKSPNLRPGQKLLLPAATTRRRPLAKSGTQVASAGNAVPPSAIASPLPQATPPPLSPSAADEGTHTIKAGDSLYAIARQHKVSLADLQRHNNIPDPTKVRVGTVLKIPGHASTTPAIVAAKAPSRPAPTTVAAPAASTPPPPVTPGIVTPKLLNAGGNAGAKVDDAAKSEPKDEPKADVAATPPVAAPAPAPMQVASAAAATKFQWPVKGSILAGFGKRPDGTLNDGVNIAAPLGANVHAAQDGTVAYAGSELKGYGNLILVRHEGGYVSAYAHSQQIMVKRGDAVKRGQVIAKSGQSGGVDKPQVHFELRKDSQPIDPTPLMEKM